MALARRHRAPIVMRRVERWPGGELPLLGDGPSERVFAWDGDELSLRALGAVPGFDVQHQSELDALVPRLAFSLGSGVPAWVGGRSFALSPGRDEWSGWPACCFWLPSQLLFSSGGECWSVTHSLAFPDGSTWSGPTFTPSFPRGFRENIPRILHALTTIEPESTWRQWVESVLDRVETGQVSKVVLARRACPTQGIASAQGTFEALGAAVGQVRYRVGWPGAGDLVGSTPETLFTLDGMTLRTEALAGTAPIAEGHALLDRGKDRREHDWVVRALVGAIEPLCSELDVGAPTVEAFGGLCHLRTPLRATLWSPGGFLEWLHRLHPTPAVAGWPRRESLELIRTIESRDRGWYAGALGYTDGAGYGRAVVALRCGLLRAQETYVYAGAGIVRGSEADREWAETQLKLERMARALVTRPAVAGEGAG